MDSNKKVLSLGQLIAELRREKGFSQRKFAQISGLSNTTISRIENGETVHPDVETLKLLAAHLDYSESKLINMVDSIKIQNVSKKQAKLKFLQQPVREIKRYSSVCTPSQVPQTEPELIQNQDLKASPINEMLTDTQADIKVSLKGMRLITLRMEKNVTQKELADELGLDKTLISQFEGEIIKPDYHTICKLADFFGVAVEYLTGTTKIESLPTETVKTQISMDKFSEPLQNKTLRPEYLAIAEEIQAAGIEADDVRAFIEMIRKYKND